MIRYEDAHFREVEIDETTATIEQINDAYNYLLGESRTDGAFPGSREWDRGNSYAIQLRALIAARPEVEVYRSELRAARTRSMLSGKDTLGL